MIEEGLLGAEELLSMADFQETGGTEQLLAPDLTNLSQYWYREDTQDGLIREIQRLVENKQDSRIAIIAAPTIFCRMEKIAPDLLKKSQLLEFDRRFQVYENFTFYDLNFPLAEEVKKLPESSFDVVLADPPFWLSEYLNKLFETINFISKEDAKVIVCAGPPMIEFMEESKGFTTCPYRPTYERRLSKYPSNQSRCYVNYALDNSFLATDNSSDEIQFDE